MEYAFDKTLVEMMPEAEKARFNGAKFARKGKLEASEAQTALALLLTGEFTMADGSKLTPQDIINMKTIGFVMANPSPQNTKALYETAGIAAPKSVDVTSKGKPIDQFLESLSIRKPEHGEN